MKAHCSLALATLLAACGERETEQDDRREAATTMELNICGTETISSPDAGAIREAVLGLDASGDAFLVLGAERMTYIQCSGDQRIGFDLEYQEGSLDRHYRAKRENFDAETIIAKLTAYAAGDASWREGVEWEKLDL